MRDIHVLRLSHRIIRDVRLSTHVCLIARAFGVSKVYYTGQKDARLENSINNITNNWGGKFKVEYSDNWKDIIKKHKKEGYMIVHLTMYGMPGNKVINDIQKNDKFLIIVGGEKVPMEVYHIVDYNVAIGNQPHSEAGALAVFLHMLTNGKEFELEFENSRLRIIPSADGKKIIENKQNIEK
ncbi:tRNA (cytidine(56)-2'-O)-methyltransferase [Candidatus Micrarchaeota archaeon]|nr:tRNA (cytidine(56)-2'-O)-methyltransferase [Candidatus Micrarchaeota archaeon]